MEAKKRKGPRSKTAPGAIVAAERRRQAVELRKQGKTFEQIGAELGVTNQAAHRMVAGALYQLRAELVTETATLRQQQLDGLHAVIQGLWERATTGDVAAVDRLVKLWDREARLAGLDAAEKCQISGPGGGPIEVSGPREALMAKLERLRKPPPTE